MKILYRGDVSDRLFKTACKNTMFESQRKITLIIVRELDKKEKTS